MTQYIKKAPRVYKVRHVPSGWYVGDNFDLREATREHTSGSKKHLPWIAEELVSLHPTGGRLVNVLGGATKRVQHLRKLFDEYGIPDELDVVEFRLLKVNK